ncbi:MAG: magnesium transporter [Gemmatimonadaceae bacterium]
MPAETSAAITALARGYLRDFPAEAARHLEELPVDEIARLMRREPVRYSAPLLEQVEPHLAAKVMLAMPEKSAREELAAIEPVRAVAMLGWMNEDQRQAMLGGLEPGLARELTQMAEYPIETAGRLMDPRALGFRPGTTAQQALAKLRQVSERRISDIFVAGEENHLVGRVSLQALAVAAPSALLETLMQPAIAVQAVDPQDEVVEKFTSGRLASLPVVDFEGRLIGVIRHDRLAATAQENAAADMQAMVGASRQERALSPVSFAVKKRLPWLEINLVTAFLAAAVVGVFEGTIAQFTALAILMPVVAGQAGNTGAQALAVTMRGLAMREIRVTQWPRVVRKEASVALFNSIAVSLTTAAGVFVWSRSPGLALVIGTSMILSMIAAGTAGVLVPTTLTRLGQDPAQSSSIILTTITDIVGFGSFLGIATVLSRLL